MKSGPYLRKSRVSPKSGHPIVPRGKRFLLYFKSLHFNRAKLIQKAKMSPKNTKTVIWWYGINNNQDLLLQWCVYFGLWTTNTMWERKRKYSRLNRPSHAPFFGVWAIVLDIHASNSKKTFLKKKIKIKINYVTKLTSKPYLFQECYIQ